MTRGAPKPKPKPKPRPKAKTPTQRTDKHRATNEKLGRRRREYSLTDHEHEKVKALIKRLRKTSS